MNDPDTSMYFAQNRNMLHGDNIIKNAAYKTFNVSFAKGKNITRKSVVKRICKQFQLES